MADTHIKIKPVTPRVQYTANGSTTVFPYSFAIFDETDMVVYVDDTIITTGYTVSGAGQTDGGEVTFDSAPDDGAIITLLRNVPIERMTDFQEGGTFRPKNLNDEFDRQTAFAQQVQEALSRCVKVDPTSESNPEEILPKVERLYDSADNIDIVANDKANVDAVAGNQTNIDVVAGNNTDISAVAGIVSDVSTVAGNTTDISNVATNMSDVNDCANNIAAIQAAPSAASSAASSAEQAAISAAGTHFKLFHHDWFDYQLNDMAWLRADTFSWQDGTIYTEAYNHLVADVTNGTPQTETISGHTITYTLADDGHKIVSDANASEVEGLYNDTGVAWYYILDTTNQRFKLPRTKYGFTGLRDTVGKYVPESLPNIKGAMTPNGQYQGLRATTASGAFRLLNGTNGLSGESGSNAKGFDFDASRVSSTYQDDAPVQQRATQMYLYFYVGQFSQSATEQTAGLNTELFNVKMDRDMSNMNPSATAKEKIVGWGMPDFSSGVSKSLDTIYQAELDGWILIRGQGNGSTATFVLNYSANNDMSNPTEVAGDYFNCSNNETKLFPIPKDMFYQATQTTSYFSMIFYPVKGAQNA